LECYRVDEPVDLASESKYPWISLFLYLRIRRSRCRALV
jgi:hypothetical protein